MKVGFTGTQQGMTEVQKDEFRLQVSQLWDKNDELEFHHGDCIGADEQAHNIVSSRMPTWAHYHIVIHPPDNDSKRAFCNSIHVRDPKPYIKRNHDIVDETTILIATPKGFTEELRSGTWATIRYAKRKWHKVITIYPNGHVAIFEGRRN